MILDNLINRKQKTRENETMETKPEIDKEKLENCKKYLSNRLKGNGITQADEALYNFLHNGSHNCSNDLNNKINAFIRWYDQNIATDEKDTQKMKNFIEKMAVWYELRYPLVPNNIDNKTYISRVMFEDNEEYREDEYPYWSDFYNTKTFINSLDSCERKYFSRPKYKALVYLGGYSHAHFHLSAKGKIMEAEYVTWYSLGKSHDFFEGMHAKDALEYFKKHNISISNELENAIKSYELRVKAKEGLLNSVMYKLLLRDLTPNGSYRALLFASEFGLDISIPLIYGINSTVTFGKDKKDLIEKYIELGGNPDIICYQRNHEGTVKTKTAREILDMLSKPEKSQQEKANKKELYQKLRDLLKAQLDTQVTEEELEKLQNEAQKQEVIRLRLERKLAKSRQNK